MRAEGEGWDMRMGEEDGRGEGCTGERDWERIGEEEGRGERGEGRLRGDQIKITRQHRYYRRVVLRTGGDIHQTYQYRVMLRPGSDDYYISLLISKGTGGDRLSPPV